MDAKNRQPIKGQVKADVKIVRIVSGLTLPVNCYLSNGTYIGSCVYNDFCDLITRFFKFNENNCPQSFIDNGFDCTCPFNFPIRELNINHIFELLPAANTTFAFFAYGDFDVTIKSTIDTTNIVCLNMKFALKPI